MPGILRDLSFFLKEDVKVSVVLQRIFYDVVSSSLHDCRMSCLCTYIISSRLFVLLT